MSMVTKILIEEMGLKDITIAASSLGDAQDLTISSKKSPTSISGRWIAFFLFFIRYYGILKMIKDKNKGVDIMKTKIIKRAYKFRIYPTLEQISFFAKSFGCVRKVHNLMLDDRKKAYEEYKSTGIKTKYPYLKEVDSLALVNV